MAKLLVGMYDQISKEFGMKGRIKFAMLTHMTSEQAAAADDSVENVARIEQAMKQVKTASAA